VTAAQRNAGPIFTNIHPS